MDESNATIKIVQEVRLHGPDEYTVYSRVRSDMDGGSYPRWKRWGSYDTIEEAQKEVKEIQRIREAAENPKVIGYY